MSDDEKNQEWQWENAGFGKPRAPLGLPMKVGPTFEEYMEGLEAEMDKATKSDDANSVNRRKMMEQVTVQTAQYQNLCGRNARALAKKKDFKYYDIPRLYRVRPVMTDKMMVELIEANVALLEQATELVTKNEKIAAMDSMSLVEFAALKDE